MSGLNYFLLGILAFLFWRGFLSIQRTIKKRLEYDKHVLSRLDDALSLTLEVNRLCGQYDIRLAAQLIANNDLISSVKVICLGIGYVQDCPNKLSAFHWCMRKFPNQRELAESTKPLKLEYWLTPIVIFKLKYGLAIETGTKDFKEIKLLSN